MRELKDVFKRIISSYDVLTLMVFIEWIKKGSLGYNAHFCLLTRRVMFFCGNIAAGDDGVSWKFFCLIKSYMVAIWPSEELQRSTIIFFWLIIRKNLRAHAIDFYWRMLSNSKWSLNWTMMHLFHESFNKIWICARKKLAKMNHENSFF